ncbi:FRG1-like family-domain-containing protein [Jimgerdemannia flammicorona]|uniref:FRG1-like family-domain-containing protein n=1 Tax=Jimgerdemannia flammicorona TaxID=994334 RepID=A0A433CEM0_9FUNG|nr:FRG1-like family-domain-containing protein [Jimgerdemannia flammicorona]
MSSDKPSKKGKLAFKGDKEYKKKKKRKAEDESEREYIGSIRDEGERNFIFPSSTCYSSKPWHAFIKIPSTHRFPPTGWVPTESLDDLVGPLFLTFPSEPPTSLCTDDENRVLIYPLPTTSTTDLEPTIVQQVFVGARIVGSPSSFSLKSSSGHYLSSDRFGAVTADREAIGPQEEWAPSVTEAGVAWQSAAYGKFLAVDEIAGGGFRLRADAEMVGYCETWRVLCQARFKRKVKVDAKEVKKAAEIEVDNIKKFQSWGAGRLKVTDKDARELKRAKLGGTLAEAMLDRREKVKADRYCK